MAWQNEIEMRSQGQPWTQIPKSSFRSKAVQGQDSTTQVLTKNTEADRLGCRVSDWEIMDLISYEESMAPVLFPWIAQVGIRPVKTHGSMNMWVTKFFNVSFSLFMTLKSNKILYECIFMHVCVHVGEHCMTE